MRGLLPLFCRFHRAPQASDGSGSAGSPSVLLDPTRRSSGRRPPSGRPSASIDCGHDRHRSRASLGPSRSRPLRRAGSSRLLRRRPLFPCPARTVGAVRINGDPAIAKAWRNRTFPDDPFVQSNARGTWPSPSRCRMAGRHKFRDTGDNTATHDKEPFTPFGRVVSDMSRVDAIDADRRKAGRHQGRQADPFFEGGCVASARVPATGLLRRAIVLER